MTKEKYLPVKQKPNQRHKTMKDYNRKREKLVTYEEYDMGLKTFEEYQIDVEQLFEAKAAFNAAVKMCEEFYESEKSGQKENPEDWRETLENLSESVEIIGEENNDSEV